MKLYWRLKVNGRWTWKPVEVRMTRDMACGKYQQVNIVKLGDEEE